MSGVSVSLFVNEALGTGAPEGSIGWSRDGTVRDRPTSAPASIRAHVHSQLHQDVISQQPASIPCALDQYSHISSSVFAAQHLSSTCGTMSGINRPLARQRPQSAIPATRLAQRSRDRGLPTQDHNSKAKLKKSMRLDLAAANAQSEEEFKAIDLHEPGEEEIVAQVKDFWRKTFSRYMIRSRCLRGCRCVVNGLQMSTARLRSTSTRR